MCMCIVNIKEKVCVGKVGGVEMGFVVDVYV